MRSDPKREAERWLYQAEEELRDACDLMDRGRYYLTLFLAQQSAEKALKAFLYVHEEEPVFTHSVSDLIDIAGALDNEFETVKDASRLDDYYIPTRYPNGLPGGVPARYYSNLEEAEAAVGMCASLVKLVRKKIESL